jgi:rubredoxin
VNTGLDSAVLEVVADHYLQTDERHFSPVQVHSAIRWRWSWLTDPEDAREVFDTAHDLAERGLLAELLPPSGLELFTDYRITEAGYAYLRDHPPPHPCQPPQSVVVDPPLEWICPDCGAMFRLRLRLEQIMFQEPSNESLPANWEKFRDGDSLSSRP